MPMDNSEKFLLRMCIAFIIIAILFVFIVRDAKCQEPDSIVVGGRFALTVELAQLGAVVTGSGDENTLLEAHPFIGTGLNFALMEFRKRYGLNLFTLFYTEGESIYPMLAIGITVLGKRFALGYNFGKIQGTFEKSYKERLNIIVSFNPFE